MNVEAAGRVGGHWCLEAEQRVRNVEEVVQSEVRHVHPCASRPELDRSYCRNRHRPEQPAGVGVDARVKVVNLGREIDEVKLTSI